MKRILLIMALLVVATMSINAQNDMNKPNQKHFTQTAGREQLGKIAPEFAHLNDDVLFGEVWNRQEQLSAHDRSLTTIVTLMAQGLTNGVPLRHHLEFAKANGVTLQELTEVVTHAVFYCGWPKAWAVLPVAKEVWGDNPVQTKEEFQMSTPYPIGNPNDGYAKYFVGKSYLAPMGGENAPINVTFEPRCRNNWHIHHKSVQVLVCVAGRGWYQEWGKEPVELKPGVVIPIPAEVKHWHGAAKDSWMQHITYMTMVEEGASNEWLEAVTEEVYDKLK